MTDGWAPPAPARALRASRSGDGRGVLLRRCPFLLVERDALTLPWLQKLPTLQYADTAEGRRQLARELTDLVRAFLERARQIGQDRDGGRGQ